MEVSVVRQKVLETIARARKAAADRRAGVDQAGRAFEVFLEQIAIPLFRQVANVLRAEGLAFTVFTPGGSVRLASDRAAEDYIELVLDTAGPAPMVLGRSSHIRGRRVIESERPVAEGRGVDELADGDVLAYLMKELEPFVGR